MSTTNHYPTGEKMNMQYPSNELVADALLAQYERDKERPYYTQDGFEQKLSMSNKRAIRSFSETLYADSDPSKKLELYSLMRAAKLTPRQRSAVTLRSRGFTFEEIGNHWSRTKQGAQRVYTQAMKKLRLARNVCPYVGLNEVYRCEIHRGNHR